MKQLPNPELKPAPITYEEYKTLTPEKFELSQGYLFGPPDQHEARLKLLSILLKNEGLEQAVKLAPLKRWQEALQKTYNSKQECDPDS